MKFSYLLLLPLALLISLSPAQAASREDDWKKVEAAVQKGLPRTAIEALDPIIKSALEDKAMGEAAKAIARKIALEGTIQGNKAEEKIIRMEATIAEAPQEIVPLLDTILANWYWHYFQNNRWRFLQRTTTAVSPGKDFTTWDLPRIFAEIDLQFTKALSNSELLQTIPVSDFDELLVKGTMPDIYRPTLYDFIAHEALAFYASGEQAGAKAQDDFELTVASPVFDDLAAFMGWKILDADDADATPVTDTNSPVIKALLLYQDLMEFHAEDDDPTARLNVDLERLAYGYNTAVGEQKNDRYKIALERFASQWPDHELSALAIHRWAVVVRAEGDQVAARNLAIRGEKAHPESVGGRSCHNLIAAIEAKSASIHTERVWNQPYPTLSVRYRNVTKVYFRAVAVDWFGFLNKNRNQPTQLDREARKELLRKETILAWSADLPPTMDYKETVQELPAPEKLPKGFYFIIASYNPAFSDQDNQVTFTDIWVSDLALVLRPRNNLMEGFILNAQSGEPLQDIKVSVWKWNRQGQWQQLPSLTTDGLGYFSLTTQDQRSRYLFHAQSKGDQLASHRSSWIYRRKQPDPYEQTVFFTDRSIYRPGQTVHFKGICLRVNQNSDNYDIIPNRKVVVMFSDPNNKEIERLERRSNDYGSFSGSFTAPRDRVMGNMRIHISGSPHGSTNLRVEEYKRPKFEVTLDPPKTAPKLDGSVNLIGTATAYTGAAVDDALVKYRVVREVRWPYWYGWYWRGPPQSGSQEIAHGQTRTDQAGHFKINFTAKPDRSISPTNEPTFIFRIYADVTDGSGETRSDDQSVQVGYTALQATLSADDWQTANQPVTIKINTTTLDGEPQSAEGSLKIYRLQSPDKVHRLNLNGSNRSRSLRNAAAPDLSNPRQWPLGELVAESGWTTDAEGKNELSHPLNEGVYRALLETQDRFGTKVTARLPLQVLNPDAPKLAIKIPHVFKAAKWSLEPGQRFQSVWGTGYDKGRAFVEIEHRNEMIKRFWTDPDRTQQQITQTVTEAMRGGFTVLVTQVRENRAYLVTRRVDVPWSNKQLNIKWDHFVSKLEPAQKETWTATITGPDAIKQSAEMVAALYDASLDQFTGHNWLQRFQIFRYDRSSANPQFENMWTGFNHLTGRWDRHRLSTSMTFRSFPNDIRANPLNYGFRSTRNRMARGVTALSAAMPAADNLAFSLAEDVVAEGAQGGSARKQMAGAALGQGAEGAQPGGAPGPDLSQVSARKNLQETAFFFPHLIADESGNVKFEFTMPEALTRWRFLGFAHDSQLRSGYLEDHTVTAKDLMVQPNPPRFLREGDELEFTVKVSNQAAARQKGRVQLQLSYALDNSSADQDLGNSDNVQTFDIPAQESRSFSWRLKVPDGCGILTYKAVASSGRLSDGEEGYLPVLSRRLFITESLPLPIRGPATKSFEFEKLLQSGKSDTLEHVGFTVQMVSNPAWYAVLALPYLMEFPHECSEQVFNRFYANALARNIANSDPKIRRIFDLWKNTPALDSPLEKNQDLKAVMIEETPWLRQAKNESQARRNVGILFDDNRLNTETARALQKLGDAQLNDGSWPWFPGGPGNDYITLYITTGFGRLRHLGADIPVDRALRSLQRLDGWMQTSYERIQERPDPEKYVPSSTMALYLYGRSFFLKDQPIAPQHMVAIGFFLDRSRDHWLKVNNRQSQGHLSIAVKRFNAALKTINDPTPQDIMRSIKERSVTNEEMGRFWRDTEMSWWWYRAPIETQALMIEAFDEVMGDNDAVEECRVWLLKQKQTQDWKTTKATADAVYALLLRGRDILASDALVQISVGGLDLTPDNNGPRGNQDKGPEVEPGTGFYEHRFDGSKVQPDLGKIIVKKIDEGVAWGSVHWQYLEDMSKITPHENTPLKLKKSLYNKVNTKAGPVLQPVNGPLAVGDEVVVRIELRTDRDMEYVHLKDLRGSGTEPVNVLSRYKFQDGLGYYETTRDTASHFFIDYLPKGTYVFEYSTRIQHRGQYQTGLAEIQCMYAPEFNSHSESLPLVVR